MTWVGEPSEPTLCVEKDIYIYTFRKKMGQQMSAVHEGWCFAVLLSVVVFLFPLALSLPLPFLFLVNIL